MKGMRRFGIPLVSEAELTRGALKLSFDNGLRLTIPLSFFARTVRMTPNDLLRLQLRDDLEIGREWGTWAKAKSRTWN